MSGYLEVKYPSKTNLGLNPFKSWKRQWCILRPSPTCAGGSLAVYCSEAGAAAGTVELPSGSVVRRTKSRSKPYAFAVFAVDEPRKPLILLASLSLQDTHSWMEKIRSLLNGDKMLGTESLLKDSYSVVVNATELSRKCGASGADCVISLSSAGLLFSRPQILNMLVHWKHVTEVLLISDTDKNRICVVTVDSEFVHGGGELRLSAARAGDLATALRQARRAHGAARSRSDGDLRARSASDGEARRSSWYSGPSDVSLDDIDLVMSKESNRVPSGQLSRCSGEGDLAPSPPAARLNDSFDDSMSDRRSLASIASGIYEEIPDLPARPEPRAPAEPTEPPADAVYCPMAAARPALEPTYESVAECAYATMRRSGRWLPPPPLPPRLPFGTTKLGESWNSRMNSSPVNWHGSLGSLPRCCSLSEGSSTSAGSAGSAQEPGSTRTLPSKGRQAFNVFRKRLKSDSRLATSPKSDTSKENKQDVETKKKKFDFTPTRDIFKNFKVGRKMKSLKITNGLGKGETKSCEFLDETEHVTSNRCSKSVECLEDSNGYVDEFDGDLSIEFNDDAVAALALPQEIVELILRSREQLNKIRLKATENAFKPMSPIVPSPAAAMEHHYMVMLPLNQSRVKTSP